jgi:iron complex outermembrane receptor protein
MKKLARWSTIACSIIGISVAFSTTAQAQIEEVVVTAQKREQSINDVPMSITAISADDLDTIGINDVGDLQLAVPGFVFAESATGNPIYTLRGIGFNDNSAHSTSTVGIYQDQISIPYPVMSRGLAVDIERIEVLKGPQGTLYGRNATAGAVNIIAGKPGEEFEGGFKLGYGSFNTVDLEGVVSGSLSDNFRARAAVRWLNSDDWQQDIESDAELGSQDRLALRLMLEADLGESTEARLTYDYWSDQSDTTAPIAVARPFSSLSPTSAEIRALITETAPLPPAPNDNRAASWTLGSNPEFNQSSNSVSLSLIHNFANDMTLTSLTNYSTFKDDGSRFGRDGVTGVPKGSALDFYAPDPSEFENYQTTNSIVNNDIDNFSQELRLSGETDKMFWLIGGYYADSDVTSSDIQVIDMTSNSQNFAGVPFLNIDAVNNDTRQKTKVKAIFANADWNLGENTVLTTGIRYSDNSADFSGCTRDTGDGSLAEVFTFIHAFLLGTGQVLAPGDCATIQSDFSSGLYEGKLDETSTSWRLALDHDFSDDLSAYISYSRGFKSGSFPNLAANAADQYTPAVQEQLDSYELGVKSTLADGNVQLNAAVFYYDYRDKQLLTKTPTLFGNLFTLANADKANVKGAEMDIRWQASEGLMLSAAATYLDTEIKDYAGFTQLGIATNFAGSPFTFTPKFSMNAAVDYETAVSDNFLMRFNINAAYQGSRITDYEHFPHDDGTRAQYDDEFYLPSYTIINARIGLLPTDGNWQVYLYGRNLTDEFYASNVTNNLDALTRYSGHPRTYGVRFEYNF